MMQPQDIQMRKMMELLESLHLPEQESEMVQDYLTGEGEAPEKLGFQDLSALPDHVRRQFSAFFRTLVNRGRTKEAQRLFAVLFAVGKSTMSSLIPSDVLAYKNDAQEIFPADQTISSLAENVGESQFWIRTLMMERLKKLAGGDPAQIRKAMTHHKSSPDNGLLILYTAYFWVKYPDARFREESVRTGGEKSGGTLLQSMTKLFGTGNRSMIFTVVEEDRKLLTAYEDLIVDSLENLFSKGIAQAELNMITDAINRDKVTDEVRAMARKQRFSPFLMRLLCGCAFGNFTLSLRLKNVVSVCLAVDEKAALTAMDEMDLRYDLRGRGVCFDQVFGMDTKWYIGWAANKKVKNLLAGQFMMYRDVFLECYQEADLGTAALLLEIIKSKDDALYHELIRKGKETRQEQIVKVLCPDSIQSCRDGEAYLMGRSDVESLYPLAEQFAGRSWYAGTGEYQAMQQYAESYGQDDFYRRCLVMIVFREAAYAFHHLLTERGEIKKEKVKLVFRMLQQEKLDMTRQLKAAMLIQEVLTYRKSVLTEEMKPIFGGYLKENRQELLTAFREADASGRCFALEVLELDGEENREEILSYSKDSSKQVRERLLEILKNHREWETGVLALLASKKAAEREAAVRTLLTWDEEGYKKTLQEVYEKEKNGKVRALLEGLFTDGKSAAKELSQADIVKAVHRGGKKRTLAWAYQTPFSAVARKDGQPAEEEYLQAILLCYASMGKPGVSQEAKLLAEALSEADLAVYMGELFDKWLEAGAEAKKRWVLYAVSIHGGSEIISKLHHQIQEWPAHSRGAIASDAVCALALNPLPQALLIVDGIARKFKFRQVKAAAGSALEFAASQLGLSREELADKIVPDLGFDERMQRIFDYGERKFTVTITPSLEIEIFDESGKKLKNMPAPGKRDQEEVAKASYDAFKEMKKQMKATVSSQKTRLELALSVGREWEISAWKELFVQNPIMHQFAIGLIWGIYENHSLQQSFRYMEDGSFNTEEEEEFTLPDSGRIGLVHPIELSDESCAAWKEQLEDYEITQPVEQLSRSVYRRTKEEAAGKTLERFGGIVVNDLSLSGKLTALGWYRGSVLDGGGFYTYYREDPENSMGAELHFSGSYVGGLNEDVTIYNIRFYPAGSVQHGSYVYDEADDKKAYLLSEVPERYFSELIWQITKATATSTNKNENWKTEMKGKGC